MVFCQGGLMWPVFFIMHVLLLQRSSLSADHALCSRFIGLSGLRLFQIPEGIALQCWENHYRQKYTILCLEPALE